MPGAAANSVHERLMSGTAAAITVSALMTPFDVVKTRMQSQGSQPACVFEAERAHLQGRNCSPPLRFSGPLDAARKIAGREGVRGLWRGVGASLTLAVPTVGLYMSAYDVLYSTLSRSGLDQQFVVPAIAGSVGRSFAVMCTSPLELVRTRTQASVPVNCCLEQTRSVGAHSNIHAVAKESVIGGLMGQVRAEGVISLWRGLLPTLLRDVPFSSVYWVGVELIRSHLKECRSSSQNLDGTVDAAVVSNTFSDNVIAGTVAGGFAAVVTHPLDVIKTRVQITPTTAGSVGQGARPFAITSVVRLMLLESGWRGLYTGFAARLAKVAPSCAIVLGTYELGKYVFRGSG